MEYLAIIAFAITTCVTPGPNNAMIMASGLNYGIRRSLPHYTGICLGFPVMVTAVGLGISYLAYRIATAPVARLDARDGRPFTFIQAAAFQWVNPKAWVLAVGATVTYTVISDTYVLQVLTIALIFLVFGAPCIMLWLWFGSSLKGILQRPDYVRIFNISMASLLMASLIPVFLDLHIQFST